MGFLSNVLRSIYNHYLKPSTTEQDSGGSIDGGHHGVSVINVGVSALARDLFNFESTSQVPDGLNVHVKSSQKAQANWYRKLAVAWRETNPPPRTPEEASRLVLSTLKGHQKVDVEGLLTFYGLPLPGTLVDHSAGQPASHPHGVKYEMQTLPIDTKSVSDGDTITVYISTEDPRESSRVPREVQVAALKRAEARAARDYVQADALQKIIVGAGYRPISIQNEEILGKKYRIRLSGIDTPEGKMPYGQEAKQELLNLVEGKCLRVLVYGEDRYGRCVGDVYCNGIFAQEWLLKKGLAWHYTAYDKRAELADWEKGARARRVGLWASPNPEKPWDWRKDRREGGK